METCHLPIHIMGALTYPEWVIELVLHFNWVTKS